MGCTIARCFFFDYRIALGFFEANVLQVIALLNTYQQISLVAAFYSSPSLSLMVSKCIPDISVLINTIITL